MVKEPGPDNLESDPCSTVSSWSVDFFIPQFHFKMGSGEWLLGQILFGFIFIIINVKQREVLWIYHKCYISIIYYNRMTRHLDDS